MHYHIVSYFLGQVYITTDPNAGGGPFINVGHLRVALKKNVKPNAQRFIDLVRDHYQGTYINLNPFDGQPHDHMQIGDWLGTDPSIGMCFMAFSTHLGITRLVRTTDHKPKVFIIANPDFQIKPEPGDHAPGPGC